MLMLLREIVRVMRGRAWIAPGMRRPGPVPAELRRDVGILEDGAVSPTGETREPGCRSRRLSLMAWL